MRPSRAAPAAAIAAICLAMAAPARPGAQQAASGSFAPETGMASWYGEPFHGRKTASGEVFDMNAMTAAHKTLSFGTLVLVTNLDDGRRVVVRINDRGPFVAGRIIDLSRAAAAVLGLGDRGVARVEIRPAASGFGPSAVVRIQVGSYREPSHAASAVESLARLGLKAVAETAGPYRRVAVYVAPADRAKAEAILDGAGWKDRLVTEINR